MFADLPDALKVRVKEHLLADDFITAKKLHDQWKFSQEQSHKLSLHWQVCSGPY